VVAFDHRIRTLQEFTSDSDQITWRCARSPRQRCRHMIDATEQAIRMLQHAAEPAAHHSPDRRNARHRQRSPRARNAHQHAISNIAFYAVDMSRIIEKLTARRPCRRRTAAAMYNVGSNEPATPNTVRQTSAGAEASGNAAEFMPFCWNLSGRQAIFKRNRWKSSPPERRQPVQLLPRGGLEKPFSASASNCTAST